MRKLGLKPIFAWLQRKLLRKRVGLLAIGIGVPWLWLLWQFFGPLSAFPVSAETTIYTEPLTPQGYVDYVKIFQDRYQHPDAKPAKEDPWCQLAGALANTPEEPKELPKFPDFSLLLKTWQADHPDRADEVIQYIVWSGVPSPAVHHLGLAADESAAAKRFLKEGEPWYAAVKNSEPTPAQIERFNPWLRDYPVEELGLTQIEPVRSQWYADQIAGAFLFRAAMHFQMGDFTDGLDDLQVVYKAARGCETYCLGGSRRGLNTRLLANCELINGLVLCPSIDELLAGQLTQLSVSIPVVDEVIRLLDERLRYEALDRVQFMHRHPAAALPTAHRVFGRYEAIATRYAAHRLDFGELLKSQNRLVDEAYVALKKQTYREQFAAIKELLARTRSQGQPVKASFSFFSLDFQALAESQMAALQLQFIETLLNDSASLLNSHRVLHLAVRLARWRTINGHYPDSLDVLNSIPGLPPMPEGVLIDAFSDEPLRYERVGDRYRIRSAGEDMEFNDSMANDETWPNRFLLPEDTSLNKEP